MEKLLRNNKFITPFLTRECPHAQWTSDRDVGFFGHLVGGLLRLPGTFRGVFRGASRPSDVPRPL